MIQFKLDSDRFGIRSAAHFGWFVGKYSLVVGKHTIFILQMRLDFDHFDVELLDE